ncbi:hypothetical protein EU520_00750 [Candidatus Thorarchaeota archaeon]|nr:MAG: hypothetical protein EU520_00750 [Candidatus Thorarchaeota archaeon]
MDGIGGRHGGLSRVDRILDSNFSLWTFAGHAGEDDVENIHTLAQEGIKVMHIEGWWSENVSNPLDVFYNETIRTWARESINFSLYGVLPSYAGGPSQVATPIDSDDLWGITLGDEEPAWSRFSSVYESVSPDLAKYNLTYHSETGYFMKPMYEMNLTEESVFTDWLCEKSNWVYNYMHDYVKTLVPDAKVFQYMIMEPAWGLAGETCAAYELKADGHAMDCYYAMDFPWLLYETVRRYRTSIPEKEFHLDIWGTIWDFLNEAGDGLHYREGSWEQIRRETWLSYLSGVDVLGYFDWAPQNNDSYDWQWGHERTDELGQRLWRYVDNLAGQLSLLPVFQPRPEVLVVGNGFQTDRAMTNVADLGLFTEYDLVNQRCFARTEVDLSHYSLALLTDGWYYNSTVEKLETFVENGGSLIFLGGIHPTEGPIDATKGFSFEGTAAELGFAGHVSFNLTLPNPLGLELVYDGRLHSGWSMHNSSLTNNHHSIPGIRQVLENGTLVEPEGHHLVLYHNDSVPESGWVLYFGAVHSSSEPDATWDTYHLNPQDDLWHLYQEVVRAFAGMLGISNSISIPETVNALVTQGIVEDGVILAGIHNFENAERVVPYLLDLSQFGFPDGGYWIHSLDSNESLGMVESTDKIVELEVSLIPNGTRLLLMSESPPNPGYAIDIFPPIPDSGSLTTTTSTSTSTTPPSSTTTISTTTTTRSSDDMRQLLILVGMLVVASLISVAAVLYRRGTPR